MLCIVILYGKPRYRVRIPRITDKTSLSPCKSIGQTRLSIESKASNPDYHVTEEDPVMSPYEELNSKVLSDPDQTHFAGYLTIDQQ